MQNLLEQYNSIKPDKNWVKQTRKELKAQMPNSNWPVYSGFLVLALAFCLGLFISESPEKPVTQKIEIVQTAQNIVKTAKKIEAKIEAKILAVKTETSQEDELDPLTKLLEDLEKAKLRTEILEEIEELIKNNDFVIAREKLDKLLNYDKNIDNTTPLFDGVKVEESIELKINY